MHEVPCFQHIEGTVQKRCAILLNRRGVSSTVVVNQEKSGARLPRDTAFQPVNRRILGIATCAGLTIPPNIPRPSEGGRDAGAASGVCVLERGAGGC